MMFLTLRRLRCANNEEDPTFPQKKEEYMAANSGILHTEPSSRSDSPRMRPTTASLTSIDTQVRADRNEISAAATNIVLMRAQQLGRGYLTSEDFRRVELITDLLVDMQPVQNATALFAPQTQGQNSQSVAVKAVSDALDSLASVARQHGIDPERT